MARHVFFPLLALAVLPLASGHYDGRAGMPKEYCETGYGYGDWESHDYDNAESGSVLGPPVDGNVDDCDRDGIYGDFDGHYEYAMGGAWIATNSASTFYCWNGYGDHPEAPTIWVHDQVLSTSGADIPFHVAADRLNNLPAVDPVTCGDFESDYGVDCVNSCAIAFPPGLDGTYQVYVTGTSGHVYATPLGGSGGGGGPLEGSKSPCPQTPRYCLHYLGVSREK